MKEKTLTMTTKKEVKSSITIRGGNVSAPPPPPTKGVIKCNCNTNLKKEDSHDNKCGKSAQEI